MRPGDDFDAAIVPLAHRGAAFHPVAAVDVTQPIVVVHRRGVDVAADHAIGPVALRLGREGFLERPDIIDRVLYLKLGPFRKRPVWRAEHAAKGVENPVSREREFIGFVAEKCEPARLCHDKVEYVAVDDQVASPTEAIWNGAFHAFDAAEMRAVVAAQKLIMIPWNVDDACTLAGLAQYLLHHVVVYLRPVPGRTQRPPLDDIADQIDRFGFVMTQKVQKLVSLTAARTQVHVGDEKRAK